MLMISKLLVVSKYVLQISVGAMKDSVVLNAIHVQRDSMVFRNAKNAIAHKMDLRTPRAVTRALGK